MTVSFGDPLPGNSSNWRVRLAIQEISASMYPHRAKADTTLPAEFIRTAKSYAWRYGFATCLADSSGKRMSRLKALKAAMLLADRLHSREPEARKIGILLPPSVGAAVANLAVMLAGDIPVNLNYTASQDSLDHILKEAEISTILSSEVFVSKVGLDKPAGTVLIEDLLKEATVVNRLKSWLKAEILPAFLLDRIYRYPGRSSDSVATIIYSSGSTGQPKGVMLSHMNILSNLAALFSIFNLGRKDTVLGILPFFHSFGFTGTLWMPLLGGMRVVYHHNPMDAKMVGELSGKYRATLLLSTPTFLMSYIRRCSKEQFAALRFVVVGAEKLKERVAKAFAEKFGLQPMEGYGCTELSPIAALNSPDFEDENVQQLGQKRGSVGLPLPGVAVKIVDPDSMDILSPGEAGLLLVKGANVMLGYLNNAEKTQEVMHNGWYITGDIAELDEDGFVTITDRLSRFSKIAGEMVPHIKIEEMLQEVLVETEQVCVVTGVPDERKGEKLVVLHTQDLNPGEVVEKLLEQDLPNLWIPKQDDFYKIESIPLLGSGKVDLKAIKQLALEKGDVTHFPMGNG